MKTTPHGWTIVDADAGVLSFTYNFAGEGTANCFTARLDDGSLMVISPPSRMTDEEFGDLAEYGEVKAVVANNGFHHLGLTRFRELAPKAGFYAAPGAAARIAKKSTFPWSLEPLAELQAQLGEGVAVVEAPGSKCGETWARVKTTEGYAWYASDMLVNMTTLPSNFFVKMLFRLSKSAPGYRVFNLAVRFIFKDRKAGLNAMLTQVREHPPTVMVPAHGEILTAGSIAADTEALLVAAVG